MTTEEQQPEIDRSTPEGAIRYSRGAQLRALVLSWHLGVTYQHALQEQATELQKDDFEISDDWAQIAEHIYLSFAAQQQQQQQGE